MSQISIDLNDDRKTLAVAGRMLLDLAGESVATQQFTREEITEGDMIVDPPVIASSSLASAADIFGGVPPVTADNALVADTGPTPPPATDLDGAGYPWDERIHSSGKTCNKDGTWKLKKGVDKSLVEQVRAEFINSAEVPLPPIPPTSATTTWPVVLQRVSAAQAAGTLDIIKMNEYLATNGVTGGMALLSARPDLFDDFLQVMGL